MEILPLTPIDLSSYQNKRKITNDQFDTFLKSPIDINNPKPLPEPQIQTKRIQTARTPPKIPINYVPYSSEKALSMHQKLSSKRYNSYFEKNQDLQRKVYYENRNREEAYQAWKLSHENSSQQKSKSNPLYPTKLKDPQITEAVASSRKIFPY